MPATATATNSTMLSTPLRPSSCMSRTINGRRTEGKLVSPPEVILGRMDSLTHVYFAWRLAEVSGTDKASAYAALFPQIDRNPPYFHRLYAHNFALARDLTKIGQEVMASGKIPTRFKENYAWKRFLQERPRILAYREKFCVASGQPLDVNDLRAAREFIREKENLTIKLTLEYGRKEPHLKRFERPPLPA